MHTLSSARRTCMASSSAVECTATEGMPSSLQARSTRSAISPRFAIRILSNIAACTLAGAELRVLFNDHQRLAELYRLAVIDQDLDYGPCTRAGNLIHGFHRLNDQERFANAHTTADFHEPPGTGLRCEISGAHHWRG